MTFACNTRPGLLRSLMVRLGLALRLPGTLVEVELEPLLLWCFRRPGNVSLEVNLGRGMLVDVTRCGYSAGGLQAKNA
jgi:hypothetical protein